MSAPEGPPDKEGGGPTNRTADHQTDPHRQDQVNTDCSGGGGGQGGAEHDDVAPVLAGHDPEAYHFILKLLKLGVPVWVARPGAADAEFQRPRGWQKLSADDNRERIASFYPGMALCANMGGALVVVDVDPRNGGDIERVRRLLADLRVRRDRHTLGRPPLLCRRA